MRELFAKYGFVSPRLAGAEQQTSPGISYLWGPQLARPTQQMAPRRMVRNWKTLITFSESPIPARAMSLIVDKIKSLDYEIQLKKVATKNGINYNEEIELVESVFENPNAEDEDYATFIGQILYDQLTFDFGCWEYVEHPDYPRGINDLLWMCPVPGWTVERSTIWKGEPNKPRWVQRGMGQTRSVPLLDSQIEAIIMRKRTSRSYGISPLEISVGLMDAWLNLTSYQAQVASDAYPKFLISMGNAANQGLIDRFRVYWNQELAGQGRPGIVGGFDDPKVLQTAAIGDDGLYPKYHEQLVRTIAYCFGLKDQDFNLTKDVNRSTSHVSQHASVEEAIKPYARAIQSRHNRRTIPRIAAVAGNPKILDLEFVYDTIDPWDAKDEADIINSYVEHDGLTLSEYRVKIGMDPYNDERDDMTWTQYKAMYAPGNPGLAAPEFTPDNQDDLDVVED